MNRSSVWKWGLHFVGRKIPIISGGRRRRREAIFAVTVRNCCTFERFKTDLTGAGICCSYVPEGSDGLTLEWLRNAALQIIHHLLSYISTYPYMRIATTAIAAAAAAVSIIAQYVAATPRSAFASSARTSAHLANSDAASLTRTTNPSPGGLTNAPFTSGR